MMKRRNCVILGAGVTGLSTAVALQQSGWTVTVVARATCEAPDSTYVSDKAGAHWFSFASHDDKRQQEWDRQTYAEMARIGRTQGEHGITRPMGNWLFRKKPDNWQPPWWVTGVTPEFSYWSSDALRKAGVSPAFQFGMRYRSVMMNAGQYMSWLRKHFEAAGGTIRVRAVERLVDAVQGEEDVSLLVNCTGLGAAVLLDVQDANVYPTRGQTLLVHAPEINEIWRTPQEPPYATYILPRGDGRCIVGGTFQDNNWDLKVDPAVRAQILAYARQIVPQLGSSDINIEAEKVGLRPSRKGGIRLEVDSKLSSGGLLVVHNYGHGGYGFQSSWGCARSVVELADAHAHAHCTKSSQSSCGAQPAAPVIAPSGGNAATGKQGGNSGSQPAASVGRSKL